MTRVDEQVDFDWNAASPDRSVDATHFGVRWTGTIQAPVAGDYQFSFTLATAIPAAMQRASALFFDGKPLADQPVAESEYRTQRPQTVHAPLRRYQPHAIRIEYTHKARLFGAGITLDWKPAIDAAREALSAPPSRPMSSSRSSDSLPILKAKRCLSTLKALMAAIAPVSSLPAVQQQLLEALAATGKPLVVVLMNGSALAVDWAQQHANAIVEAWYPGEEGGTAIADTLTGKNNPAGRLPVTFYAVTRSDLPPFDDYSMSNRTYRYFQGKPLWGFGYGLSYSTFKWTNLKLSAKTLDAGSPLIVEADVENVAGPAGDAVSELYLTPPAAPSSPQLALVGFERTTLAPHTKQHVRFAVDARALSTVDANGVRAVRPGEYTLHLGGSQPSENPDTSIAASFSIRDTKELPR